MIMKIIAADSGCSELDDEFNPTNIISTSAVFIEYPYLHPRDYLCNNEPFPLDSPKYAVRELSLASKLATKYKPDQIHIDVSLGGLEISSLSEEILERMNISKKGRDQLIAIIDELREIGERLRREVNCKILFLGKESWAIRIAELNTAACAIKYGIEKIMNSDLKYILIGLPKRCTVTLTQNFIISRSLYPSEINMFGFIRYAVPKNINMEIFPNPNAMGFYIAKLSKI